MGRGVSLLGPTFARTRVDCISGYLRLSGVHNERIVDPSVAPQTICAAIIIAVRAIGWRVAGAIAPVAGTQPK